jgi:alkylation response protein AidB-like acyl-CoA dehydrogenase
LTVLMFERLTLGGGGERFGSSAALGKALAADPAARADAEVRHTYGEISTELLAVRFNGYRALSKLAKGQIPGPEAGLAKVTLVNAGIKAAQLGADLIGPNALEPDTDFGYLTSFLPGLKSAGGTEQILKNTIGERVLGLPPEPRLDKGIPFSELRSVEKEAVAR